MERLSAKAGGRQFFYDTYRRDLRDLGTRPVIARRGVEHGSGLGVHRWVVEAAFALLRWFRRLRIRWEVRDNIHEAFLTLDMAVISWQRLKTSFSQDSLTISQEFLTTAEARASTRLYVYLEQARIKCISVMGRQPTSRCARPAERDRIGARTP
ncbi:hypothetical protein [Streptomyces sp. NPDC004721]